MSNVRQTSTKAAGAAQGCDRHRYDRLATRQPAAVIEAMNHIARKRNTTVAAILGEAAIKTLREGRALLPQKLQRKLRGLAFDS
jgi:hypothetical protein